MSKVPLIPLAMYTYRFVGKINRYAVLAGILGACSFAYCSDITAVWANEGGDKVTQDELRASHQQENSTGKVINRAWNGTTITLSGARNEVLSFNLVLEAATSNATNVTVTFNRLQGLGSEIANTTQASGNGVFDWVGRPIELFYVRYLQIQGLSFFGYGKWDERQIPKRLQRPWTGNGVGTGTWLDRPDHDKFYPDIMVPMELVQKFNIQAGQNQSVWADIYIPRTASPGMYAGLVTVSENGIPAYLIPVQLNVYNFALPDEPSAKTMANVDTSDIMWRYITGYQGYVNWQSTPGELVKSITDKYFQLLHRHKISAIGENECSAVDSPCPFSVPRLDGSLFTAQNGYDGPGVGTGVNVYSIGTYGTWNWRWDATESLMWQHADNWASWFQANSPSSEYFIYLEDEPQPQDMPNVESWAEWIAADPGQGSQLLSMSTHDPILARSDAPSLDIPVFAAGMGACPPSNPTPCNVTALNQAAADFYTSTPGRELWAYNDSQPATGCSETECDGIAFRQIAWAQYKKNIHRWFYWDVNVSSPQDWFQQAVTWGSDQFYDDSLGEYGNDGHSNGNGLLLYAGTDVYSPPSDSYGVNGPFASLRLKEWRRGIQDVDYLTLAAQVDPAATQALVNQMIPQVLWEYPATDPGYYVGPISWPVDPDMWEAARAQLAQIIVAGSTNPIHASPHYVGQFAPMSDGIAAAPRRAAEKH